MTNETEFLPSKTDRADFVAWLEFIMKDKEGNIAAWANHLIAEQDWSASKSIEVSGRQTMSGNPEFYTF